MCVWRGGAGGAEHVGRGLSAGALHPSDRLASAAGDAAR